MLVHLTSLSHTLGTGLPMPPQSADDAASCWPCLSLTRASQRSSLKSFVLATVVPPPPWMNTARPASVPHKDFSDLYEKMSGKGESASGAHRRRPAGADPAELEQSCHLAASQSAFRFCLRVANAQLPQAPLHYQYPPELAWACPQEAARRPSIRTCGHHRSM